MKYLSVCSGIEAATVAWHHMGWQPAAFSEIEAFPSAVLAHRYPTVPNWGDMNAYEEWPHESIDLLAGGTPCQAFSIAGAVAGEGSRKGLADPRGNLALVYCRILKRFKPSWFVWENVPGVLSINGGRDFGTFLGALGKLGYSFSYRVLDSEFFGVAQRRRRVFVVGHLGDWRCAAAVLFDSESLRGNPRRIALEEIRSTSEEEPNTEVLYMTKPSEDRAQASPTKQFFVSMLTRDISLADAILDLLDNCLDGALRLARGAEVDYAKHFVKIEIAEDHFSIADNCGGIPREVAKNYAFKMGREPDDDRDSDAETIGMYGVGMKRAIFKMGRNALVRTRYGEDTFEVPITSEWLDAKNWDPLPINEPTDATETLGEPGTTIHVRELYEGVARHFANAAFENEVRTAIAEHFTMFLQSGLKVEFNGAPVEPVRVEVLVSEDEGRPAPYVYQKTIDDVIVSITVGLNTGKSLGDDEEDDAGFERDRSSVTAGWTVLCNDRAVIVGDKSRLTGWGDGIPLYHPQFAIITGIIEFRSKRADKLPVTTTKRALDTSSNVWLESLVKMKEGMRIWISYTNQWKNHPRADQSSYWETAKPMPLSKAIEAVATRKATRRVGDTIEFNPQKAKVLPEPEDKKPSSRKIVFARPAEEVRLVSKLLFDDSDERPGIVGDKCFEMQLTKARKQGA